MTEEQFEKAREITTEIFSLRSTLRMVESLEPVNLFSGFGPYKPPASIVAAYIDVCKDDLHHKIALLQAELSAI